LNLSSRPRKKVKGRIGFGDDLRIVKQSEGHIGSIAYRERHHIQIYLPRVNEPLEEVGKGLEGRIPRGNETILIVEDEKEVLRLAANILERQGYRVLESSNGDDALGACEKHKSSIDLVLAIS